MARGEGAEEDDRITSVTDETGADPAKDAETFNIPKKVVGRVGGIIIVMIVALGAFAIGRTTVSTPSPKASTVDTAHPLAGSTTSASAVIASTTTVLPPTSVTTAPKPITTSASPTAGATLATCTAAVTGYYFPKDSSTRVQLGGLSTVQRIGYACPNTPVLSEAMAAAGGGTVYNGDVTEMKQDVCNNYPTSTLCVN